MADFDATENCQSSVNETIKHCDVADNCKSFLNEIIKNDIRSSDVIKFNSKEKHSMRLVDFFKELLDKNVFCDLDLTAAIDGTKISVHRNVLLASSQYFNVMLSTDMKEARMGAIELKDVDGDTLRFLINYCYTGEIEITSDNIETLLPAASRYEFVEIEEECSKFLGKFLKRNPLNCIAYYTFAHLYNLVGLKELARQLICKHFMEIKDSEDFLALDVDELIAVIKSDDLMAPNEEEIFNAVMSWIARDEIERKSISAKILEVIRFTQMDITFLAKKVVPLLISVGLNELCYDILKLKSDPDSQTKVIPEFLLKPRITIKIGEEKTVENSDTEIIAFICEPESRLLKRERFSITEKSWKELEPVRLPFDSVYAILPWKNLWFIFEKTGWIACVDKNTLVVQSLQEMPNQREDYSVASHNDCIYIIGGYASTIEKYDIKAKIWNSFSSEPMYWSSVEVAIMNMNNEIYCSHGFNAYKIDLNTETVTGTSSLHHGRIIQIISYNDELYFATTEHIYDPALPQKCRTGLGSTIMPNIQSNAIFRIYLYSTYHQYTGVDMYSPKENRWLSYGELKKTYLENSRIFLFYNYDIKN